MSYKFIFDNSVLDQSSIVKLQRSRLKELCLSGSLSFYMMPILLEEFLHFIPKGKAPNKLKDILSFIRDLSWRRFYNTVKGPDGIYTMELEGRPASEYLFVPDRNLKQTLQNFCQGGEFQEEDKNAVKEYNQNWKDRKGINRKIFCEIRDNVKLQKNYTFQNYLENKFEENAIRKIMVSISSAKPKEDLVNYWKSHEQLCPHFNKFVEGEMYVVWYAYQYKGVQAQDSPIDTNAQDDVEYLVYLNNVDCIVSNDRYFMKKASKELFPNKDCLSVDEFIEKIS